jgi:acyl-CoA thioester hydrolase
MTGKPAAGKRAAYSRFCSIAIRWMDVDAYRHVNNVVYYSYFDTAVNEYLITQGVLDVDKGAIIGLVVETQCQYFSPVEFPGEVQIGLRVGHIGNSSVRYELAVFVEGQETASAQGHFVHVYVDRDSMRPTSLPAPLREAVSALQIGS